MDTRILRFIQTLVLLFSFLAVTQAQNSFQRYYDEPDDEHIRSLQLSHENGYVMAGHSNSYGGDEDIVVICTDSNGTIRWANTYGGSANDRANHIEPVSDGGYVVTGMTNSFGVSNWTAVVLKLNGTGDLQWGRVVGGEEWDEGYMVKETPRNTYIVVGRTGSAAEARHFGAHVYLFEIDDNGTLLWSKGYEAAVETFGFAISNTFDHGYILSGFVSINAFVNHRYYLLKTDSAGNKIWSHIYGNNNYNWGSTVLQTPDSGYIMTGTSLGYGSNDPQPALLKVGAQGSGEWFKLYRGNGQDYAEALIQAPDGGFVISGRTNSFGAGNLDAYLLKTNNDGTLAWSFAYGGTNKEESFSVTSAPDGQGFALAGNTWSFDAVQGAAYLVQTSPNGNSSCHYNTATPQVIDTVLQADTISDTTVVVADTVLNPGFVVNAVSPYDTQLCGPCLPGLPKACFTYTTDSLQLDLVDASQYADTWDWTFGDGGSDTVPDPIHTYADTGTYEVCLEVSNACGSDLFCDSITVTIPDDEEEETGIRNPNLISDWHAYPNPASSKVYIRSPHHQVEQIQLTVFDLTGKTHHAAAHVASNRATVELDVGMLPPGIYMLRITGSRSSAMLKLLIAR